MRNLVLIGLSGSGKSTLGRRAAAELGRPFEDLDALIEKEAGLSITEIFARYGEDNFRDWECETIRRSAARGGAVVATGGGAVLRAQNVARLRENGLLVYLDRPVAQILSDIETAHRPLLAGGAEELKAMDAARRPLYQAAAHLTLPNGSGEDAALERLVIIGETLALGAYAVIGDPIGHSLSPVLHRAVFGALRQRAGYTALRVPHGALPYFVATARCTGLRGFNVTIPHKRDILPLLDEVEPAAARCGAVNTVVRQGERLVGHNTDMEGLRLALARAGLACRGRRVLLLGAGGAARAAAFMAAQNGAQGLHIMARREEAAQALAAELREELPQTQESTAPATGITFAAMGPATLALAAAQADVFINATPLGMRGTGIDFDDLSFINALPAGALVCDLVYAPPQTRLLQAAQSRGLAAINGLDMLIYQALLADELFLGKALDKDGLYEVAKGVLCKNKEDMAL